MKPPLNRPSPLEVQDAVFGATLRTITYATAVIAVVVLVSPWEAGPDGTVFTWDLWSGTQVFYLLPVVAGVLLAALGALESVPGMALGGAALVASVAWMLACPGQFEPVFGTYGAGADGRETLVRIALPVLLGGLAWRRALHMSLVARAAVAAGAVGVVVLFVVPMGEAGTTLVGSGIIDAFSTGETVTMLSAVPLLLTAAAALASLAALLPSRRSEGGTSTLAFAAFHVILASVAFGHVLPHAATLGDGHLSYASFAVPLKLGALWWTGLLWLATGAGVAGGAVEGLLRRQPVIAAGARGAAAARTGPGPSSRPMVRGEDILAPPDKPASRPVVGAPAPLDLSPLPPPPGFNDPPSLEADAAKIPVHEPSEVLELSPRHALPLLETQDAMKPAPARLRPSTLPAGPSLPPPPPGSRPSMPATPLPAGARTSAPAAPAVPAVPAAPVPDAIAPPSVLDRDTPALGGIPPIAASAAPAARSPARARTLLGTPAVMSDGSHLRASGPPPDESGRTGDTSLGVPAMRPKLPAGALGPSPAPPPPPGEVSGLRYWPQQGNSEPTTQIPEVADTPVMGVEVSRAQVLHPTPRGPEAAAGARPGRYKVSPSDLAPEPTRKPPAASDVVGDHVSTLQRRLARGEITAAEYQRRLDQILKLARG